MSSKIKAILYYFLCSTFLGVFSYQTYRHFRDPGPPECIVCGYHNAEIVQDIAGTTGENFDGAGKKYIATFPIRLTAKPGILILNTDMKCPMHWPTDQFNIWMVQNGFKPLPSGQHGFYYLLFDGVQ